MKLNDRIVEDINKALKEGDRLRLETLRMVRAAFLELQKSGADVTDEREVDALVKQGKRRRDAAEQYRQAGRNDLAEKEEQELAIIAEYLPRQLSEDEIRAEVKKIVDETGASSPADLKLVMPKAMASMKGQADGAKISAVVRDLLSGGGA